MVMSQMNSAAALRKRVTRCSISGPKLLSVRSRRARRVRSRMATTPRITRTTASNEAAISALTRVCFDQQLRQRHGADEVGDDGHCQRHRGDARDRNGATPPATAAEGRRRRARAQQHQQAEQRQHADDEQHQPVEGRAGQRERMQAAQRVQRRERVQRRAHRRVNETRQQAQQRNDQRQRRPARR